MNSKEYIVIHHTAVSREKNDFQFEAVRDYHKRKGWGEIGYHYFIEPDGTIKRGREDDQQGAHVKEDNINTRSIGVCLAGNFDKEEPTKEQTESLRDLIFALRRMYGVKRDKIKFHRYWAEYKSCPGQRIKNNFLKKIIMLKEVLRDEDGGFWFVKAGDNGKQKIESIGGILTILSREFGVKNVDNAHISKLEDKKYF